MFKNMDNLMIKINNLKKEFKINPDINSVEDIEFYLDKDIEITHILCGTKKIIKFKDWLKSRKDISIKTPVTEFTHFCDFCLNNIKKSELQEYLDENYNKDFIISSDYKGFKKKLSVIHRSCGAEFEKTPSLIKSKRLYCKSCGKSDYIYEENLRIKKNKELQNILDNNNCTTHIPLDDYIGNTLKMKYKHLTCGNEFEISLDNLLKHHVKKDTCPVCLNIKKSKLSNDTDSEKKRLSKLRARYRRLLRVSDGFEFNPNILDFNIFKDFHDKEIEIKHNKCFQSFKMSSYDWLKQRGYTMGREPLEPSIYLCPHCYKDFKTKELQNYLDENYNYEFELLNTFEHIKIPVIIKHKTCGDTFESTPDNILHRKVRCKSCKKADSIQEEENQKIKNQELMDRLKKSNLLGFTPQEDLSAFSKDMKFKHERCGNIIETSAQNILRHKNKVYCSKCPEKMLHKETDIKKRSFYAQEALNIVNNNKFILINEFDDDEDSVSLKHKECLKEFTITKRNLFFKEILCPHCETNTFKNNRYISINNKIKLYEEILDNEYSILKPFLKQNDSVPIRHNKCGHEFKRTISAFLRSKDKLLCPKCRDEIKYKEISNKLYSKYKDEYKIVDITKYESNKSVINFIHKDCGTVFSSTLEKMQRYKNTPCPKCNENIKSLDKLKNEVYKKYKGEYIVVGDFNGRSKKTYFRHKTCGKKFPKTPTTFFKSNIPCPTCQKNSSLLGLNNVNKRLYRKSNGLFQLNGVYRGILKEIPVTCNICKETFMSTPKRILEKKTCPLCGSHCLEYKK